MRDEFEKWFSESPWLEHSNIAFREALFDAWQAARAQGACEWAEQLDACEFHGSDHEVCAEYSGQVPCARAQSGQGAEPVAATHTASLFHGQRLNPYTGWLSQSSSAHNHQFREVSDAGNF